MFRSFAHFLIGLFVFLEWSHVSSLYILEIRPLSEVSLANMFSHTVGSLFILMLFSLAMQKQPKCPSASEWIKKLWYIYTVEFYAAERKKELIPFATAWMELESIMLSEISQTVRDKYHVISPLTGTLPTKEKSKQNRTRDVEIKNSLTTARGEQGGDSGERGLQELL